MATNQEAQTLDETLNKTDLGHVINEHRKSVLIAAAVMITVIIGYAIFDQISIQNKNEKLDRLFTVEQTVFKPFLEQKENADSATFITSLNGINNELIAEPNLIPLFMESLNKLSQLGKMDAAVIATTQKWLDRMNKSSFLHTLLAVRLAALYEDAAQLDKAITTLELLLANKKDLLKDKIYFELGRMYLAKGDKNLAKERFDYLFENHAQSEFAKNAKILMSEL